MLLRSSSTPILGSLLSSSTTNPYFSNSPNTTHHHHHLSPAIHVTPLSEPPASSGIRRTRSDGNLHALMAEDSHPPSLRCSSRRPNSVLETVPSFSIYNSKGADFEEEEEEDEVPPMAFGGIGREFSVSGEKQDLGYGENDQGIGAGSGAVGSPLFLARGLGIDRLGSGLMSAGDVVHGMPGGGGGGGNGCALKDGNGGGQSDLEMYYKRMVEEDPSNALFLSNYAMFLYKSKGDLRRAEEYYSRAILSEPGNGEIMSQYAKLVWELHHDEERASNYFLRAIQASPEDSHVLAAYAGFLWETDDDDNVTEHVQARDYAEALDHGALASASTY